MSWQKGLGGAASGAAGGAAIGGPIGGIIGGGLGLLGGIFGGGDDDAEAAFKRNRKLYEELLAHYHGPEEDPEYASQLAALAYQARSGGLTPADRAAMLDAYSSASDMARGREGAIAQQQQMRGGGVASSGQNAALQAQAAQLGAQRYQTAGMQQAGIGSQRAQQARLGYLQQIQNNKNSLNNYRLNAASGMTGANVNEANYYGAQGASNNEALTHGMDTAAQVGMYLHGKRRPTGYGYSEGDGSYGGNSYYPDEAD